MESTTSEAKNTGQSVLDSLNQNASLKNIFGEPIETQGKTIIPVAQVVLGLGGGDGQGKKKAAGQEDTKGEGSGAGAGLITIPKGVFEVKADKTRFIPVVTFQPYLIGIALGFVLGWLSRRPRK